MTDLLTIKQVARALGVSESSLKRWCDEGRVPAMRTAGGHRRLRSAEILQLVRQGRLCLAHPESLGLPPAVGRSQWTLERVRGSITGALVQGEYEPLRRAVLDMYVGGHSLASICDGVLAAAMNRIGCGWEEQSLEVYEERRATCMVSRLLEHLHGLIPAPTAAAPLAMGAVPAGDPYSLATQMAELSLCEAGWRAVSLGGPLPFDSLQRAVEDHLPRLFWISISHVADRSDFLEAYQSFYCSVGDRTAVVVGGRALDAELRQQMRFAAHCESMCQLVDLAAALQAPVSTPAATTAPLVVPQA